MYEALKANIDRIATEAAKEWKTGAPVEPLIKKRLEEVNMLDWIQDVRMKMTKIIHADYLNSRIG